MINDDHEQTCDDDNDTDIDTKENLGNEMLHRFRGNSEQLPGVWDGHRVCEDTEEGV